MDSTLRTHSFKDGIKDGVPIALGYLSVSFAFGIIAVNSGLPVWLAVLISMTNLTSAGQFSGVNTIIAGSPYFIMALSQFIINLRYSLMSLSLSQKLDKSFTTVQRLILSFGITDEIFGVASQKPNEINTKYMYGLITLPYWGWAIGTLIGATAGNILPYSISSALNIAIYGMFIAIIIPPAKESKPILRIILFSVAISFILRYMPYLNKLSDGMAVIICAIIASTIGAVLYPVKEGS